MSTAKRSRVELSVDDNNDKDDEKAESIIRDSDSSETDNDRDFEATDAVETRSEARSGRKRPPKHDPGPSCVPVSGKTGLKPEMNFRTYGWKIRVRVTEKTVKTYGDDKEGKLLSMILLDNDGAIKATAWRQYADEFNKELQEGKVYDISGGWIRQANKRYSSLENEYELNLDSDTTVKLSSPAKSRKILDHWFNFTRISQLDYLEPKRTIDTIGVIVECGKVERVYSKEQETRIKRREVTLVDRGERGGMSYVILALWEDRAQDFSGKVHDVLALREVKTSEFYGVSLSAGSGAKTYVNPSIKEAKELKKWYGKLTQSLTSVGRNQRSFSQSNDEEYVPQPVAKGKRVSTVDSIPETHNDDDMYKHDTERKGLALIFNNKTFPGDKWENRDGSDTDANRLEAVLGDIGYDVTIEKDLSAQKMREAMAKFKRKQNHGYSAVVVVLSHGEKGSVIGSDGHEINVSDLISHLNNKNCRALRGKPKLFFLQACRGDATDEVKSREEESSEEEADAYLHQEDDEVKDRLDEEEMVKEIKEDQRAIAHNIPTDADLFVGFATAEGYISVRNKYSGSWFIQTLCQVMEEKAASEDLNGIMAKVTQRVSQQFSTGLETMQVPVTQSALTKKLFFYPRPVRPTS